MGITNIYFVRHAQSDITVKEDAIRPLTPKGLEDTKRISKALKNARIHKIYSSPYQRTIDTVKDLADTLGYEIVAVDDFRERHVGGWVENFREFSRMQWEDFTYRLDGGESLGEVQERNVAALLQVLKDHEGQNIAIGTHGTALSTILNYYDPSFGYESFWNIVDRMPYILRFQFEGSEWIGLEEIEIHGGYEG